MNRKRLCHIALLLLILLPLCAQQTPTPQTVAISVGSARINASRGEVSLYAPQGVSLQLRPGQVLPTGALVETARGSILLDLSDGSQVLVKDHSRVLITSPNQGKGYFFEMLLGKVLTKVQKRLGNAPSFKMGTPTAVVTVRGTRFLVTVNQRQETKVEVYEGLVEVASVGGTGMPGVPILLSPGFETEVPSGGGVGAPRHIMGLNQFSRPMTENERQEEAQGIGGGGSSGAGASNVFDTDAADEFAEHHRQSSSPDQAPGTGTPEAGPARKHE